MVASDSSLNVTAVTARLVGGGNVVVWVENGQPMARIITTAGGPGDAFAISTGNTATAHLSVTPAPDGGFLVLWTHEVERAVSQFSGRTAMEVKRFAADGTALWETQLGGGQLMGQPMARATSGGFVVAWTSQPIFTMPEEAFLQLLANDGSLVGPAVEIGRPDSFPFQHQVKALPLQDGSILAVWSQGGTVRQAYVRRYDANLAPIGAAVAVAGTDTSGPAVLDAELLATGDVALAWYLAGPPWPQPVRTAVVATDGTVRSAMVVADGWLGGLQVIALGAGGYGVAWQTLDNSPRSQTGTLWLQRFDNTGAVVGLQQQLESRPLATTSPTDGTTSSAQGGFNLAGGADGHFVATFGRIQASTYLLGR